jgi:HlyD family secretion protein
MGPVSRLVASQLRFLPLLLFLMGSWLTVANADERLPVTVVVARQAGFIERIPVVGSLAAKEEVQAHAHIQGQTIEQILVEVGQTVEKGQALAVLDMTDARLLLEKNAVSLLRAKAAVSVEQSRLEVALVGETEARQTLERSIALQPRGAVSQQVLDQHRNAYARAMAERGLARQSLVLAQAEAEIVARERKEIEVTIERSTIRAPAAGTVLTRTARLGAMTSSSGGSLFVIAQDAAVEFVAQVPEISFNRLRQGMAAEVTLPGIPSPVTGTVRLNAAQVDIATRSGEVRISLENAEGLRPGVFARGSINASSRRNIILPGSAVKTVNGSSRVFVVKDGVVDTRAVTTGARQDGFVEIIDGIRDGEMIVLKSGGFLKDQEAFEPVLAASGQSSTDNLALSLVRTDMAVEEE